ncbi:hypothetical protein RNZ50_13980 [Paracoccaceae bacterium Fryx2]|nr:hypothetical protein [Paracoccaceae bacterium Fryx2]
MARPADIGTLAPGGALTWLDQLCLASFRDAGHGVTLFHFGPAPAGTPPGITLREATQVAPEGTAPDRFRLLMLRACPGMIWAEPDTLALGPVAARDGWLIGSDGAGGVSTALLAMPARSRMLTALLADPLPSLLHALHAHDQQARLLPAAALAPLAGSDRRKLQRGAAHVAALLPPGARALRLWPATRRDLALKHAGLPPAGSFLAEQAAAHGIDPAAAPIAPETAPDRDAALIDAIDLPDVASFADIAGTAPALALAAWSRWDCTIALIDLDPRGAFPASASPGIAAARARLIADGVPADKVQVIASAVALHPFDVIANLAGFGDVHKVKHLEPLLKTCLHADTRLLTDIRKGSGAFPFLAAYGTAETLSRDGSGGTTITRVLLRANAPAAPPTSDDGWSAIARTLAGPDGFFRDNGQHSFLYMPRGDTLVVTFDNLDIAMTKREDRRPWGFGFIEKQGWSMLGVMANGWTWYRDPWVWDQFDQLAASGFFARFKRVVFYGASMGGYAACAFVAACPGADVVAISPQSTLDRAMVPWETRYKTAWDRDFTGKYGDAAEVSRAAGRVTLLYDPFEPLDSGHATRFTGPNVLKLRASLMGHRLGSSLQQMGILAPITLGALNGTLTESAFYRALRARKTFPRYQRELFKRALDRGRPDLARRLGRWVLTRGDNRFIRQGMAAL